MWDKNFVLIQVLLKIKKLKSSVKKGMMAEITVLNYKSF